MSDQEEHDEYDAKYYSDRLDKLISKYLSDSKMSEQEAIETLKSEAISVFNIETFPMNENSKEENLTEKKRVSR
jgi:hypothetical protein